MMGTPPEETMSATRDPRQQLIHLAQRFSQRGWLPGGAGQLSARLPDGTVDTTVAGRPKDALREEDFVTLGPEGRVLRQQRHSS